VKHAGIVGSLRGENNPVKADDAVEVCTVVEAKVFVKPPAVSDNRHPVISFGASEGSIVLSAFECRLTSDSSASQLHDWRPCQSPVTFRYVCRPMMAHIQFALELLLVVARKKIGYTK
jgi:hypothetical protein